MKKFKLSLISVLLSATVLASALGSIAAGASDADTSAHDISTASLTLTDACGDNCTGHTVTGTSTSNTITISSGRHTLTLSDVSLTADLSPISIAAGAELTLKLDGENTLKTTKASYEYAAISVPENAKLTIEDGDENGIGSLDAEGDRLGAGIGSNLSISAGTIIINSGYITARSIEGGASIGGGNDSSYGGTITINGGTVIASGSNGAGIGGGHYGAGGNITINGGHITASSEYTGAGIGGGYSKNAGTVTITGGTVTATSFQGAGIGGGCLNVGGSVTITGGNIMASSVHGSAVGAGDSGEAITPTNGRNALSLVEYTIDGAKNGFNISELTLSSGEYGANDVSTLQNKLYLYLPTDVTLTEIYFGEINISVTASDSNTFKLSFMPNDNGVYEIDSAYKLTSFVEIVKNSNTELHAKLTADIDLNPTLSFDFDSDNGLFVLLNNNEPVAYVGTGGTGDEDGTGTQFDETASVLGQVYTLDTNGVYQTSNISSLPFTMWTPIATALTNDDQELTPFMGTFDGNGKTISGLVSLDGYAYAGLFGIAGYATIKNVTVENSILLGTYTTGAILGSGVGVSLTGCASIGNVVLAKAYNAEKNDGGIAGGVVGLTAGDTKNTVSDCFDLISFTIADITAGGILGGGQNTDFSNCYDNGLQLAWTGSFGKIAGVSLGTLSFDNVYYVGEASSSTIDGISAISEEKVASGELAYLLQDGRRIAVWGQSIGEDDYPTLGGKMVYKAYSNCTDWEYSNTSTSNPRHVFGEWTTEDDTRRRTCSECGHVDSEKVTENVSPETDNDTNTESNSTDTEDTTNDVLICGEEEESGCGSSVGTGILFILPLIVLAALTMKKKAGKDF